MDILHIEGEYKSYCDANMLYPSQEFNSYFEERDSFGCYDSSSPEGAHDQSLASSKNIIFERKRRCRLNQKLYALRSVVPNITKMDKASIVRDAIGYIESLHDEERKIQAEISGLESGLSNTSCNHKRTTMDHYSSTLIVPSSHPIQLLELRVSSMGERTTVVSLTCSKGTDTMVKLCEIFESLNLKIVAANITSFSGRLFKTVFLEGVEEEREVLSLKIRTAIAALNDPESTTMSV